jgi:anti-sigma28 factor (negative regulator of flagellin synthesis)
LGGGSAGADSIRISSASSALAGLAADRAARVQQLAAQLKAGTYNVPASDIGRAMVAHAAAGAGMNK